MAQTILVTALMMGTFQQEYPAQTTVRYEDMCNGNIHSNSHSSGSLLVFLAYNSDEGQAYPTTDMPNGNTLTTSTSKPTTASDNNYSIWPDSNSSVSTEDVQELQSSAPPVYTTTTTSYSSTTTWGGSPVKRSIPSENMANSANDSPLNGRSARDASAHSHTVKTCSCSITTDTNIKIHILKVSARSAPEGILYIGPQNRSSPAIKLEIRDYWNVSRVREYAHDFDKVPLELHVENVAAPLSMFFAIEGDRNMQLACQRSGVTGWTPEETTKGHGDTLNELHENDEERRASSMSMLIIGSVLFVVGFMMVVVWLSLWKKYRAKKCRLAKKAVEMELKIVPCNNYEEITETAPRTSVRSQKAVIEKDPPSKASVKSYTSSTSMGTKKQENSLTADGLSARITQDNKDAPSPSKATENKYSFFRKKKSKRSQTGTKGGSGSTAEESERESSSHQEDYEEVDDFPSKAVKNKNDIQIPTPFLLATNAGESFPQLKKTVPRTNDSQERAKAMPKLQIPSSRKFSEDYKMAKLEQYSHLDRSGRSQSLDIAKIKTYDTTSPHENDEKAHSQTAEHLPTKENDFDFLSYISSTKADLDSVKPDDITDPETHPQPTTNTEEEKDDVDHIYEPFESTSTTDTPTSITFQATSSQHNEDISGFKTELNIDDEPADYSDPFTTQQNGFSVRNKTVDTEASIDEDTYSVPDDLTEQQSHCDDQAPLLEAQSEESDYEIVAGDIYDTVQEEVAPPVFDVSQSPVPSSKPPLDKAIPEPLMLTSPLASDSDTQNNSQPANSNTEQNAEQQTLLTDTVPSESAILAFTEQRTGEAVGNSGDEEEEVFVIKDNVLYESLNISDPQTAIDVRL